MNIIQTLRMDFSVRGVPQTIYAKQDDSGSLRGVAVSIYNSGVPIEIDDDAAFMLRYKTAQGAIGLYDTLPDGSSAFAFHPNTSSNTVTVTLVDQIFASPGVVECELRIMASNGSVSTWSWFVDVAKSNVGDATIPSDYINVIAGYAASAAKSATEAKTAAAAVPNVAEYEVTVSATSSDYVISTNRAAVSYWGEWCFLSYLMFVRKSNWSAFSDFSFRLTIPVPSEFNPPKTLDVSGIGTANFGLYSFVCGTGGNGSYVIDAVPIADINASSVDLSFSAVFRVEKKT